MSPFNCNWYSFPEGSMNFNSSYWGDAGYAFYNHNNCGQGTRPAILPSVGHSPGTLETPRQLVIHGLGGGIETHHSSPTNLSSIYTNLTQDESPSNYPYQIQSTRHTQDTRYPVSQTVIHNDTNPGYPQYARRQEQQSASCFQSRGFHPNLNAGNLAPSSLPAHCQPTRFERKRGNVSNYPSPSSHACHICGIRCKRLADLYRHLNTVRKHRAPQGPVCPELGCKHTVRFTRIDNFRAHYTRVHGKSGGEADRTIQEWRDRANP
ncbi:hypothetical protein HOY80DRAFT_997353 [Tuber brumale]|nr:hypothetical protein HOY80DRAFT_997353 [Tuber brumale]